MAHSPQGPGWWQASDGQWYPPESHPSYQTPAAQAAQPETPAPTEQYPQYPPYPQQPQYAPPGQPPYPQQPPQAYGAQPPHGPQSRPSSAGKWLLGLALLVGILLIAGVAVVVIGSDGDNSADRPVVVGRRDDGTSRSPEINAEPDRSMSEDAADATGDVDIIGPSGGDEEVIASAAIVDIENYWRREMPEAYGEEYQPVEGGFYSWSPDEELPPCVDSADNIAQNAFYCGTADVVAWDDTELVPHLYETYGDLSVAIVFAHEWGHAIQARSGMQGAPVTLEQQADCFAGAWVADVRDGGSDFFTADGPALDRALGGFIEIADTPGTSALDPNAHGSAFDRINSFQEGLEEGASACVAYDDQSVGGRLVQLEFETQEDFDRGGNAPYFDEEIDGVVQPGIISMATTDLEDYWSTVGEQEFGTAWTPLNPAQPFESGDSPPSCGGDDTEGYRLFYCAPDRFIAYEDDGLFQKVYDALGDFAVATLYGGQYSLAAQDQFGVAPDEVRDQNLMADCMTGSWAASVFLRNRETSDLILSPGDLDEAVQVLLALGSTEEDGGDQGTGFERVKSFRDGVIDGVSACVG